MTEVLSRSDVAYAKANGIEIAYETFGDPTNPAMLLIMGLGSQMVFWDETFCELLAARGFWIIRFDNRDAGLSTILSEAGAPSIPEVIAAKAGGEALNIPYTLDDMTDDAIGLMDALGIESAHVAGRSMGGMIGQLMALHYPQRTRSLISIMSTTGDPNLPSATPEALEVLVRPIPLERSAYIEGWLKVWEVLSGPEIPVEEHLARKWADMSYERGPNPSGFLRQMAAVIASGSRKDMLKDVVVPTLVIHGDADPLIPVECGIDTANSIPGATLRIIKGMGHTVPEAVWPEMIDAIADHAV